MDRRSIREWRQDTGESPMVCRTCRHGLTPVQAPDKVYWIHALLVDHPADPVLNEDIKDSILICDFCGTPEVVWNYPTRNVSILGTMDIPALPRNATTQINTGEEWAACLECHNIIQSDAPDKKLSLARRSGNMIAEKNGKPDNVEKYTQAALLFHREAFWEVRSGDPWPEPGNGYTLAQLEEMFGPDEE